MITLAMLSTIKLGSEDKENQTVDGECPVLIVQSVADLISWSMADGLIIGQSAMLIKDETAKS